MNKKPKTIKKLAITLGILAIIGFLHLDNVLVGENFFWTAFFIFLGLALLFNSTEEKDEEIEILRYVLSNAFGSEDERREAKSYTFAHGRILEDAKNEFIKKYGSLAERRKLDEKLKKDENEYGNEKVKK